MNSFNLSTLLLVTMGFFVAARLNIGKGNSTNIFSCQPIDRIFVRQGAICFQKNATMKSCSNQTCQCTARSLTTTTTTLRPGNSSSSSNSTTNATRPSTTTSNPFVLPSFPPIPRWNCTKSHSNSTTASPSNSSTTIAPGGSSNNTTGTP